MCGITGSCDVVAPLDGSAIVPVVRAMTASLRHRGPDGDGLFSDAHACLGHRRLKVIDLSDDARQPMVTPDGSAVLAFNGEIYNHRDLRRSLAAHHAFRSASDTEALLAGYVRWGTNVFSRANGMFAAAVWEPARRRLVLARDHLGKKPLFYWWDGAGQIAFASELKALLLHPRVSRRIDPQSLAAYFAFGYVPTPRTIFEGIHKVPQGAHVVFEAGTRTITRYWELPTDETDPSEARALDALDELLHDAVRIRLASDVPLGFFLSGGIDSSLVTAIARRLTGEVHTFTAGFSDPRHDERAPARAIAAHLGTQHRELEVATPRFAHEVDRAPAAYDEPFADSSLIPTLGLARATRAHVTVALSGDGGDELFGGYTKYANYRQLAPALRTPASARALAARLLAAIPANTPRKLAHALGARSADELVRWLVTLWKPDELVQLVPGTALDWDETAFARAWTRFAHRDPLSRMMAADLASYTCDDILQKLDRASMAVGLEVRSPLLDHRIVELAVRLPLRLKIRHGRPKHLLRALLARYLPRRLWARPKHGFTAPIGTWYRDDHGARAAHAIRELAPRFPSLSSEAMTRVLERHLHAHVDGSQKLFTLDALHAWTRMYLPS